MITRCDDYVEFCREAAQRVRKVEDLAYRGRNTAEITRRVNASIVREVELSASDDLVDIGCGDGTLLRLAKKNGVANAIGLLATEEEVRVVRRLGLQVRQALTHSLPIPDRSASVVVCNNVLLVVPRERIVDNLCEIERIAGRVHEYIWARFRLCQGPILNRSFPARGRRWRISIGNTDYEPRSECCVVSSIGGLRESR